MTMDYKTFHSNKNTNTSIVFNDDYKNVLPNFRNKYFDIAICDIPYGIDVGNMSFLKETKKTVNQKNGNKLNPYKNKKTYDFEDWDKIPPTQEYFDELKRISHHQIIFGIEYVKWDGIGTGRIKWDKGVAEKFSFKNYELAYCSMIDYQMEIPLLWSGMMQVKGIMNPMVQQGNKKLNEKRIHPCHKPIMLYDKLYKEFGFKGMKIIDTHLGGGSNRISADKFGVSEFIGIEINKMHFDDQEKRYANYKSQLELF